MVKGISRQVIVVDPQDKKLFEQAIFILSDEAKGRKDVTDEMLLKEANRIIRTSDEKRKNHKITPKWVYTAVGALTTGAVWLLTLLL